MRMRILQYTARAMEKYLFVLGTVFILVLAVAAVMPSPLSEAQDVGAYMAAVDLPLVNATATTKPLVQYVEITDGCGPYYGGDCLNLRGGPGEKFPKMLHMRSGVVLQVDGSVEDDTGRTWYKVVFGEWLRYPDRLKGDLYVAADYVRPFYDYGAEDINDTAPTTTKRILVDRSEQKLYAYDGDALFMETSISTGLDLTPTPRGNFKIYRKTPTRYMQGPLPGVSDQFYDLPGVPWNLYFTKEGGAIHGAYWHDHFGQQWSHGCVNLPFDKAKELYEWAPLGATVTVRD